MSLKVRIAARLKAKFPGVGLSKKSVEAVSAKLAEVLTEDSSDDDIDEKLDERNGIYSFEDQKKYDDYLAGKAAKEKADAEKAKGKGKTKTSELDDDDDDDEPNPNETPMEKMMRQLLEQNKTITAELAAMKGDKVISSREKAFEEKLKGFPEKLKIKALKDFRKMKFETDEEFEAHVDETVTDLEEVSQSLKEEAFGSDIPSGGSNIKKQDGQASKEELDKIMPNLKI